MKTDAKSLLWLSIVVSFLYAIVLYPEKYFLLIHGSLFLDVSTLWGFLIGLTLFGAWATLQNAAFILEILLGEHLIARAVNSVAKKLDITESGLFKHDIKKSKELLHRFNEMAFCNKAYKEIGSVGNLKCALDRSHDITHPNRGHARQAGGSASRGQKKSASSSDDGDGDGGDGEPPRPRLSSLASSPSSEHPQLPLLLPFRDFAAWAGISTGTLRNAVSSGKFPKPIQTPFGPRFTDQHVKFVLNPPKKAPTTRGRGRPRIAQALGKGGAQ